MTETTTAAPRDRRRIAIAAAFAATALTLTGVGVYAGLSATATGSHDVSSGTLKLTTAANGVGFSQPVSLLAPGDVVDRYVTLTNGGTLSGKSLTLRVAHTGTDKLVTDATNGLQVTVKACSTSWTPATGVCSASGTVTTLLSAPVANLGTDTAFTTSSYDTLAGNATVPLQIALTLPSQSEVTTDGTLPSNTIQGNASTLSYTFTEVQRDPVSTTS